MDNPNAFPHPSGPQGMTLRDWFAGQALGSVITATSAGQNTLDGTGTVYDMLAQEAYRLADAMLAERTKPHD